jgi:signal transduction histidine kinase
MEGDMPTAKQLLLIHVTVFVFTSFFLFLLSLLTLLFFINMKQIIMVPKMELALLGYHQTFFLKLSLFTAVRLLNYFRKDGKKTGFETSFKTIF